MPEPHYIICALSKSVDRETNNLSFFNVIEGITVTLQEKPSGEHGPSLIHIEGDASRFTAVATWMRTANDANEDRFDWKMEFVRPDRETTAVNGEFSFGKNRFYRINVIMQMVWPAPESGTLVVSCSIRPSDGDEESWITQSYKIPVTVIKQDSGDSDGQE
jgi:hypothetical protein